jgi:hypothetical protein
VHAMTRNATLVCNTCGKTKPEADFAFKIEAAGIRHSKCRTCTADYNRDYYAQHAAAISHSAHARKTAQKDILRALRTECLKGKQCQNCGQNPAEKINAPRELTNGKTVSDLIRNGWGTDRFVELLIAAEDRGGLLCVQCAGRLGAPRLA